MTAAPAKSDFHDFAVGELSVWDMVGYVWGAGAKDKSQKAARHVGKPASILAVPRVRFLSSMFVAVSENRVGWVSVDFLP